MYARALISLVLLSTLAAHANAAPGPGLRLGLGTDISGGLAYGAALTYTRPMGVNAWEFGFSLFGGSFEEDTTEGVNTYHETTDVGLFAVMANHMFQYGDGAGTTYLMLGAGAGAFSVDWTEESPTDPSLGTPFGNGSSQSEDGSSGGTILNLGVGRRFSNQLDVRLEAPIFFIFSAPGEATSVVPTLSLTGGVRF